MTHKVLLAVALLVVSSVASAKDLTNRLGIGTRNGFYKDLPSIAASYFPNNEYAVFGAIGLNTQKDNSSFGVQVGLRKIIFEEKQMNFFMGGSIGMTNFETSGKGENGYEVNALAGGEFFFNGLDSLGLLFETGIGVVSTNNGNLFRTIADHPLKAGIIFYF